MTLREEISIVRVVSGFFVDERNMALAVDLYRGKQVGAGRKSIMFSVTYRLADRTLTNEEVNESQQRLVEALQSHLGATLRS